MKKRLLFITFFIYFLFKFNASAYSQTFSSGLLGINIPNNTTSLYLPINVSGLPTSINSGFGLERVCFDLLHTANWDIDAELIAPDGTRIQLTADNGDTLNDYTGTCFKMDATASILYGQAPFTGNYRPQGDFGAVNNGQNPNGFWALIVTDDFSFSDTGIFNNWSLTFSNNPAQPLNFSSNLPIVVINTLGQYIVDEPKKTVNVGFIYNGINQRNNLTDPFNHFFGKAGIEIRGSSSQLFPKKSYSFKTIDNLGNDLDTTLLGMPSEHDWILDASYTDKTLIRNVLSYRLFGKMGHYSVRTRYVELVINAQYQGIYILAEKIKRDNDRVDISKLSAADIAGDDLTGGYIIKIDRKNTTGTDGWYSNYASNITGDSSVYFQYEYPSHDVLLPVQKKYIKNYVDTFETVLMGSNFDDPVIGYRKYISITSFMDYLLMNEVSKNVDGYRLSEILFKDKSSKGGKLKNGPVWDFDIAWKNANYNGGANYIGWQWQQPSCIYFIPFWWKRFMEDATFVDELKCRYQQLRLIILDTGIIRSFIDSNANYLNEALTRNFYQWPTLGKYVWPNPQPIPTSYQGEIVNLKNWINKRIAWMDTNLEGICTSGLPVIEFENSFEVYPNPFTNYIHIKYNLTSKERIKLELLNSIGVQTQQLLEEYQLSGIYEQDIITENLPAGIYVLKLTVGNYTSYQKVIKAK